MIPAIAAGVVVAAALVALALVCVRTWHAVRDFGRSVAAAGDRVAEASAALETAQREAAERRAEHAEAPPSAARR